MRKPQVPASTLAGLIQFSPRIPDPEMKKKIILVLIAVFALIGAYTVPFIPVDLPPDTWSEAEFEAIKPKLKTAADRLNRLTFDLTDSGYRPPATYNLIAKYGTSTMKRPLLGPMRYGNSQKTDWAFVTWALPGIPHLRYDRKIGTVQVTPETYDDFMKWVSEAKHYPGIVPSEIKTGTSPASGGSRGVIGKWGFRAMIVHQGPVEFRKVNGRAQGGKKWPRPMARVVVSMIRPTQTGRRVWVPMSIG